MSDGFEPKIVAFFCNWCTYLAADLAGTSRIKYAPNAEVVRVMCSGRVDVQFVLKAFAKGADGVLIGGCHPGDCHYQEGDYKDLRRYRLLKRLLKQMGIESWPAPGRRVAHEFREPCHSWHVRFVRKSGSCRHTSLADGRIHSPDLHAPVGRGSGDQASDSSSDSRLGGHRLGGLVRPRRAVSGRLFHAGFFRHDDSQSPWLPPDS